MDSRSLWIVFVSALLFISCLNLGPLQIASARVFTTFGVSQLEVDFPCAPDLGKGCPEWCQSVPGLIISYEYVRGMIV
jgi:hypothetical protein